MQLLVPKWLMICVYICYKLSILLHSQLRIWHGYQIHNFSLSLSLLPLSLFLLSQTAFHGFPSSPTAISFEPEDQFLSIGTKNGEFRIYGRPGVEFRAELDNGAAIQEIFSLKGLHQFITVSTDNRLILWQLNGGDQTPCSLTYVKEYRLDPEG